MDPDGSRPHDATLARPGRPRRVEALDDSGADVHAGEELPITAIESKKESDPDSQRSLTP